MHYNIGDILEWTDQKINFKYTGIIVQNKYIDGIYNDSIYDNNGNIIDEIYYYDVMLLNGPNIIKHIINPINFNKIGENKYYKLPCFSKQKFLFKDDTKLNLNISNEFIQEYTNWSINYFGQGYNVCLNIFINRKYQINKSNKIIILGKNNIGIYNISGIETSHKYFECPEYLILKYLQE